jgi:hypothetical protein
MKKTTGRVVRVTTRYVPRDGDELRQADVRIVVNTIEDGMVFYRSISGAYERNFFKPTNEFISAAKGSVLLRQEGNEG